MKQQEEEDEEPNEYTTPPVDVEEEIEENYDEKTILKCSVMGGTICLRNEECNGEEKTAYDAICCIGDCVEKPETPKWKLLGWGIIIIVVLIIILFFTKYRNTRKQFRLLRK